MKLIAETLTLERGGRTVVADVSFDVDAGHALVLTGANGAGKTTLLRALAGLFVASAGRIFIDGGVSDQRLAEQCHFVGHLNGIKGTLSVAENLSFWARYLTTRRVASVLKVDQALERLNLSALADTPAAYLSAGQKRRLGLARLLVVDRPIWLLDEPTVSLDATSVALVSAAVNAHLRGGGIAVAATHLPLGLIGARELRLGSETRLVSGS